MASNNFCKYCRLAWVAAALAHVECVPALEVSQPALESIAYQGGPTGDACLLPRLSSSARYLTFSCYASDMVPGDVNARWDVFMRDRATGVLQRLSVDSQGHDYPYDSGGGLPADDGRAAFNSTAPLVPGLWWTYPMTGVSMTYLRNINEGSTTLLSRRADGQPADSFAYMQGSANFVTNEVALISSANLYTGDSTFPISQVYVRNWVSGDVELISSTSLGGESDSGGELATLSYDSRYVVFLSKSTDLTNDNPLGEPNLFVRDRLLGHTRRLTFPIGGSFEQPFIITAGGISFTSDGRYIVFASPNRELVPEGAQLSYLSVFRLDLETTEVEIVSTGNRGQIPDEASTNGKISADGRYLAFFSRATNLLDAPQQPAVYVKDLLTGEVINVSESLGPLHEFTLPQVALSADGSTVAFEWRHAPETPIVGGRTLIYSVELRGAPPMVEAVPVPAGGRLGWYGMVLLVAGVGAWASMARRTCVASENRRL